MTFLILIALAVAAFAIAKVIKTGGDDSPDLRYKRLEPERATYSSYDDDDDDEIDDDFEPVWETTDFMPLKSNRPDGFVNLPGRYDISIAGTNSPQSHAVEFIKSADVMLATVTLTREPENTHDANAIRVMGRPRPKSPSVQIGYIPATVAAELTQEFGTEMPLGAELRSGGLKNGANACFVSINLIGPPAAKRRKYMAKAN